jgi:hypothetical protein
MPWLVKECGRRGAVGGGLFVSTGFVTKILVRLELDPEKREPVFRKDHAQIKEQWGAITHIGSIQRIARDATWQIGRSSIIAHGWRRTPGSG